MVMDETNKQTNKEEERNDIKRSGKEMLNPNKIFNKRKQIY